jgi:hypothetical protein
MIKPSPRSLLSAPAVLYTMFTVTAGIGLYTRLTGRRNPALDQLKLGRWGLPINVIAFHWSIFEFINIAWPPPLCGVARRALVATLGRPVGPWQHPWAYHALCADRQSSGNGVARIILMRMQPLPFF